MFKNKNLLITGGTGSLGKALLNEIKLNNNNLNKIIIFSRDELKQYQLDEYYKKFPNFHKKLRFFLGDIRDPSRLNKALYQVDYVIHAAALKQVPYSEYNPTEFIETNINGAKNLLEQCVENKVKKIVALSTDKACEPINLYGATKLCSDKLFVNSNSYYGNRINASVVRYGNVMNSRGSVLPFFLEQSKKNLFTITHKDMTRFNITLEAGVELVMFALLKSLGGEIFVPKIPSFNILDLAKAINPKAKIKYIGLRPGEKISEKMISSFDSDFTYDLGKYFAIVPSNFRFLSKYNKNFNKVKKNFSYTSENNKIFLDVKKLKKIIKNYI